MVVIGDLTVKWGNNNWVSMHYTVRVDKLEEGSNMYEGPHMATVEVKWWQVRVYQMFFLSEFNILVHTGFF